MNEPRILILALKNLQNIVDQIHDNQWDTQIPEDFPKTANEPMTLRDIVNYHAYDIAWIPDMLVGRTMEEAGKNQFDGDLIDGHPKTVLANYVEKAVAAAKSIEDKLDFTVHCSFGDFSATDYLQQITLFHGLRSYDIAKVVGANTQLPETLVEGIWQQMVPRADELRNIGVFGPLIVVPEDAPLQDRLLGLTGRKPS
jgi:hypothetical protein